MQGAAILDDDGAIECDGFTQQKRVLRCALGDFPQAASSSPSLPRRSSNHGCFQYVLSRYGSGSTLAARSARGGGLAAGAALAEPMMKLFEPVCPADPVELARPPAGRPRPLRDYFGYELTGSAETGAEASPPLQRRAAGAVAAQSTLATAADVQRTARSASRRGSLRRLRAPLLDFCGRDGLLDTYLLVLEWLGRCLSPLTAHDPGAAEQRARLFIVTTSGAPVCLSSYCTHGTRRSFFSDVCRPASSM